MSDTFPIKSVIKQLKNSNFFRSASTPIDESDSVEFKRDVSVQNVVGGAVDIKEISLIIKNGQKINLLEVYNGIIVEESLFSSAISGAIRIIDVAGGLEKFVIRGGESIHIKVCKPKNGDVLIWRQDLIVTKVGAGEVDPSTLMTTYELHFSSRTYINSLKKTLFKSYKQQPIAEAVVSIYREISKNDIFIEDPRITLNKPFVCAGFMPHKAIDYLAQRSCGRDNYYVFFEKFVPNYGSYSDSSPFTSIHYFGSIEKLIRESETSGIQSIFFAPKENANRENFQIRATNFKRKDNFNHIPAMMLGFYNTTISSINPLTRQFNSEKLSYTDRRESAKDFYSNKLIDDENIFARYDDTLNEIPGRKLIFNSLNDSVAREDWLKNHIYGYLSKNYFKISIDIQGATNKIGVGHVVNFVVPSQISKILSPTTPNPSIDPIYSGKYLVTSVVHIIKEGQYIKTLELSRGSSPYDLNKNSISEFDVAQIIN
jgi:hypothetical protein